MAALLSLWVALLACSTSAPPPGEAPFMTVDRRTAVPDDVAGRLSAVQDHTTLVPTCGGDATVALTASTATDPSTDARYILHLTGRVVLDGGWTVTSVGTQAAIDVGGETGRLVQGVPVRLTCLKNNGAEIHTGFVTVTATGEVLLPEEE